MLRRFAACGINQLIEDMQGFHLFTFKDIPVSVQPMFFLLLLILTFNMDDIGAMVVFALCAFIGILFHEFGHALVARHYGLTPAIILNGLGGVTTRARSARPSQDFRITFMGPLTNLILAAVFFGIRRLCFYLLSLGYGFAILQIPYVDAFLFYMMMVNLVWGVFNLLPVLPMDGGKVTQHLLHKFFKERVAETISVVVSFIFAVAILVLSIINKNIFMIMIGGYFVLINCGYARELWQKYKGGSSQPKMKMLGIQAEGIYERGLVAARNHDWKNLEVLGHQMKKAANNAEQQARAYEFLVLACTNLAKYDEALLYVPHARQSDAVKQAATRCRNMIR